MVVTLGSGCADQNSTNLTSVVVPVAKRFPAPEACSPARKTRRKLDLLPFQDVDGMQESPPKRSGELLQSTQTLEQRLRFVSPGDIAADPASDPNLSGLVMQMNKLNIARSGQDAEQSSLHEQAQMWKKRNAELLQQQEATGMAAEDPARNCKRTSQFLGDASSMNSESRPKKESWRLCAQPGSLKKIHTTEDDGWQIVEEYGDKTPPRNSPAASPERTVNVFDTSSESIAPSNSEPSFSRQDTADHFQWLVENLPHHASTYDITIDTTKQQIVIKTNNRKYYKRIDLPEVAENGLPLDVGLLTWTHSQSTLTVSYAKPVSVES